jgi:GtrA-like protein
VATVVTFVGNRQWAFRHRQGKGLGHETVVFMVLNVVGLIIQETVVGLVHYGLSLTDAVSYNIALSTAGQRSLGSAASAARVPAGQDRPDDPQDREDEADEAQHPVALAEAENREDEEQDKIDDA